MAAVAATMLATLAAAAATDGAGVAKARTPPVPHVRRVHPTNRVAVVCDGCGGSPASAPRWVADLSARLTAAGYEALPVAAPPPADDPGPGRAGWLAVVDARPAAKEAARPIPVIPLVPASGAAALDAVAARLDTLLEPPRGPAPVRVLFVVTREPGDGLDLSQQAAWVARYARLDADFLDVHEIGRVASRWLDRYAAVVLATPDMPLGLAPRVARTLDGYVARGGGVAAVAGVGDDELMPLFGILSDDGKEKPISGIACEGTFVPGAGGLDPLIPAWEGDTSSTLSLDKSAVVHCRAAAKGARIPIAFTMTRGAGRAFYWHGGQLAGRSERGLLLLAVLEAAAPAAAAMLDALVFYVDDCPRPIWGEPGETPADGTAAEDRPDARFFLDAWWPSASALMARHRIKPTYALMMTYDGTVAPPFRPVLDDGWGPSARTLFARAVSGPHELALHGYNHQSLTLTADEKNKAWPGSAEMEAALIQARAAWPAVAGTAPPPRVYVPAHNVVDPAGKRAVLAVFPEVTAIASIWVGDGAETSQEFGPDPDLPGVTDVPRVSYGYPGPESAFEILSALASPGVFSHFVHPDDILDPKREKGQSAEQTHARLGALLERVDAAYPFLRRLGGSELAAEVVRLEPARLEVTRTARSLQMRTRHAGAGGMSVMARLPRGASPTAHGCEQVFAAPAEGRFHYRLGESACTVRW